LIKPESPGDANGVVPRSISTKPGKPIRGKGKLRSANFGISDPVKLAQRDPLGPSPAGGGRDAPRRWPRGESLPEGRGVAGRCQKIASASGVAVDQIFFVAAVASKS